MNNEELDHIYKLSKDKLDETSLEIKRYSYDLINWGDRLIGIRGARGVGKTTLLLQKILDSGKEREQSLYVSLDNV